MLERVAVLAVGRPRLALLLVGLLGVGGGVLALGLKTSAGTDTLVSRGSDTFKATERYHANFGEEPILVLVKGDLAKQVLTSDVARLVGLEGCISGNAPPNVKVPGGAKGPCAAFARERLVRVVYGPGTFINEAVRQIQDQFQVQQRQEQAQEARADTAAREVAKAQGRSKADQARLGAQARQLVQTQFLRDTLALALRYGIRSIPQLNDPGFVSQLVFDPARGATTPKARFAYLFPNTNSSLIQVRLRPGLSDGERDHAISLIRAATRLKDFRMTNSNAQFVVTGAPVVLAGLAGSLEASVSLLLVVSLIVMALALLWVFTSRLRLLPLAVALVATGILFGFMRVTGTRLTMASIAVLPVLVGLAVDYAIQLQSRIEELRRDERLDIRTATRLAARVGAPTVASACLATSAGFLVLLLSPVPMVRGFGALLVIGVLLAFVCALVVGPAALALAAERDAAPGSAPPGARPLAAVGASVASAWRGALDLLGRGPLTRLRGQAGNRGERASARVISLAGAHPSRVLAVAAGIALAGFALDTQTRVVSDVEKLVPQNLRELRDVKALQKTTGVSGEIDVTVAANDLTEPAVLNWMVNYQRGLLTRYGYSSQQGCGRAQLCPALSLPDLFRNNAALKDRARVRALLDAVPPYFSQAVITQDRRLATLAFGIRLGPLDRQQQVIQAMRRQVKPPPGVEVRLVGLPVLAAEANAAVSSSWRRLVGVVIGLALVAFALLVLLRDRRRALVPLIPIGLAGGWSALVLFLLRVPLNPMSVTLGALVIAITTEFSVLLAERYRQERIAGHDVDTALARTYASTGRAVIASGVTAIAGFAVLAVSDVRMLRDFGLVTVVDLIVALAGVLVVLPAVLVLVERGELQALPSRALAALSRIRLRPSRAAGRAA
jgi:hydrophobe/amphiphile efflux-3 (HAE3) family protein